MRSVAKLREVAVVGIGETKFGSFPDRSLRDLVSEAGNKAIIDSGLPKEKIQALYLGNFNSSYLCGQSHMGALVSEELNLGNIPTLRVENACASGGLAFRMGMMMVATGVYDYVLVGGVEKMTHRETEVVTSALASAADSEFETALGATFPSLFAMIANRYMYEYKSPREHLAMVAVQNHDNALLNPDAQMHKKITVEKALTGLPVASPFTLYDCSLITDGAVFVVITTSEIAKSLNQKRPLVEVVGSGHAGDSIQLALKKSLTTFSATVDAAKQAYDMARLNPEDIDFAEVHDCFTITQIINTEDLGFFEKGLGGKAVEQGLTSIEGKLPINPSGGLKAKGHPIGATGLSQIFEVTLQLRGEAGERQLKNAEIGLAHNIGGTAASCSVHILRRR